MSDSESSQPSPPQQPTADAIAALQSRVQRLEQENTALRQLLLAHGIPLPPEPRPSAMHRISPQGKVALFASLFKGRTDVFARRWHSRTTGKSGYQPVCLNEWKPDLCNKRQHKCADCPNRQFALLTADDLYRHLSGHDADGCDVVGLYPILPDNTCHLLCADFDDKSCQHGFMPDVLAFVGVCKDWHVPAHIERSRSGNGAHVWIFFNAPMAARKARQLGFALLTEASRRNGAMSFASYDRFFPNQDVLPPGGLGNHVALPLQGRARREGNSVFVDESFCSYPDQWDYLQGAATIDEASVTALLESHATASELGPLSSSDEAKPWEPPSADSLSATDFPRQLHMVRANMLYFPREELSATLANHLRRLAAFKNPEFYSRLGMRLSTHNTPRIIACSEVSKTHLALPRGCEEAVAELMASHGTALAVEDMTQGGTPIPVRFNGTLRDDQTLALDQLSAHRCGVLSAATAFGKTVVASALIARRGVNTLVLVHTKALLDQWRRALQQFLTIDYTPEPSRGRKRSPIGALCTGENSLHGVVDIALMQSCTADNEVKPLVRDYGMVIVDECHHVSSVTFERVMREITARYVYGLTATPMRKDGHQPIIFMQCGPIRFRADALTQMLRQTFLRTLVPRFTPFRLLDDEPVSFPQLAQKLSDDALRNDLIVCDVAQAIAEGRTPIVLTSLTAHVATLCALLQPHCPNVVALTGSSSARERKAALQRLRDIPDGEPLAIVATGRFVGEGFDLPRLDTLMLALPVSWKGLLAQYAGRLHRDYGGKREVRIYDYVDLRVPVCDTMYRRRLRGYAAIGYTLQASRPAQGAPADAIISGKNFRQAFLADLAAATESVVIASPTPNPKYAAPILTALREATARGLSVTLHTRTLFLPALSPDGTHFVPSGPIPTGAPIPPPTLSPDGNLFSPPSVPFNVIASDSLTLGCAILDRRLVWYGDINILGYAAPDATAMHLTSPTLAQQLLDLLY